MPRSTARAIIDAVQSSRADAQILDN
jgi:hypothetical protein